MFSTAPRPCILAHPFQLIVKWDERIIRRKSAAAQKLLATGFVNKLEFPSYGRGRGTTAGATVVIPSCYGEVFLSLVLGKAPAVRAYVLPPSQPETPVSAHWHWFFERTEQHLCCLLNMTA